MTSIRRPPHGSLSLQPTREGIQSMMDFLAGAFPEVTNTKVDNYVDNRLLARLPTT